MNTATSVSRPGGPRLAGPLLRTQTDERLAMLAGEGSQQAFDEIVKRHRAALVAYAGRIAPPDRADDVVQESMVKAFLALSRGDRPELPKAWLFKIVRNTALNDRRDWKQFDHLDENYDGVEQPPAAAERRRQLKQLVVALRDLPEAQRKAIVQRELEGRGHDEIAEELNVSPGAVRQLIFRARGTLRAGLGALIPMQLLRWVALAGADPATPVAAGAGAGLGLGAAKVGLGAVLATGAVVVGAQVGSDIKNNNEGSKPASAEQSVTEQSPAAAAASEAVGGPGANSNRSDHQPAAAKKRGLEHAANTQARQLAPPPLRRLNPPPPGQAPRPGGQQSGPQSGPGGATTQHPPGDGTGQHHPPPPPPGGTSGTGTLPPPPSP